MPRGVLLDSGLSPRGVLRTESISVLSDLERDTETDAATFLPGLFGDASGWVIIVFLSLHYVR